VATKEEEKKKNETFSVVNNNKKENKKKLVAYPTTLMVKMNKIIYLKEKNHHVPSFSSFSRFIFHYRQSQWAISL
jgi:hypothetical protein